MLQQINGGKMKKLLISLTTLGVLAGCYGPPVDEGDQYFDRITTVPGEKQAQNVTAIAPPQPIAADAIPPQNNIESGVPVVAPENDAFSKPDPFATPAATAPTPAPAKGLYEPSLSSPEGESTNKKRKSRATKPAKVNANAKSIDLREYAATQTQLVGEKKYSRSKSKYASGGNCHEYSIPEIAQIAFLNEGGPRKDPLLLDADGDGFACAWVPQR
jgi:hypothetical protein